MIRRAEAADVPALVEMGKRFHRESVYANLVALDHDAVSRSLSALANSEAAVFLVAEDVGEITGSICGVVGPHYMTGSVFASELFWWVTPGRRGHGLKLLRAYEAELEARGVQFGGMIAPNGSDLLARVYERKGYKMSETVYVKDFGRA